MIAASAMLGGCALAPEAERETESRSPVLGELAAALPGRYATVAGSEPDERLSLEVGLAPGRSEDRLRLVMAQSDADDDNAPRRFMLGLTPADESNRLDGEFAPMTSDGNHERSCAMVFRYNERGLAGETDPQQCRFGESGNETGLLKEIAFDGRRLVIGDRLIDLASGQPAAPDR
ncbi:MAG: hypothetical protein ACOCSR_03275, partial [Wenzhouxiangella sp.]